MIAPLGVAGSLQLTSAKSGLTNRTVTSRGAEGAMLCICGVIPVASYIFPYEIQVK